MSTVVKERILDKSQFIGKQNGHYENTVDSDSLAQTMMDMDTK